MSLKDTMTRFDEKYPYSLNHNQPKINDEVKQFIQEEIKLALEGITPEEKYQGNFTNDEFDGGFDTCVKEIKQNINNYLKLN
jgi:hypothetical protein